MKLSWRFIKALLAFVALWVGVAGVVAWLNLRGEAPLSQEAIPTDAATIARGAYLARAGNCIGCHTERGGVDYAGGRGIDTPFGTVYAPNLTPDAHTGLGAWTPAEFWRAMHHGRSKDGRLLYPAFPYENFTLVTRGDSDALFAYLRSLPATPHANTPHALRFPYNLQASLAVWRALYFKPDEIVDDSAQSPEWNRGRYLVRGLGHCNACHADRNALGATVSDIELGGGLIPMQNWYAPSLASSREAGVADWQPGEIVALLKTGVSPKASVMGPMAEVVMRSTQYLNAADLSALAAYLKALPQRPATSARLGNGTSVGNLNHTLAAGEKLYSDHCANCHGAKGEGTAGMYPALAGNRAVALVSPNNLIKAMLHGGFAPATSGNPRPFGMPPFAQSLSDVQVAAVATYLRRSWGHDASEVSALDVLRAR